MTELLRRDQDVVKGGILLQCALCQHPVEWVPDMEGAGYCACSQWDASILLSPGAFEYKVVRKTFVEQDGDGQKYNPKSWQQWADDFDNRLSDKGWRPHNQYVIDLLMNPERKAKSILDLGCCIGTYIAKLREAGYKGDYLGWDVTPQFIKRAYELNPDEEFAVNDVRELHHLSEDWVETIICMEVLMHLPDLKPLGQMFRIAKDRLIVSTYGTHKETYPTHDGEDGILNWHHNDNDILAYIPDDWMLASRMKFRRYDPPWPFHVFEFVRKPEKAVSPARPAVGGRVR